MRGKIVLDPFGHVAVLVAAVWTLSNQALPDATTSATATIPAGSAPGDMAAPVLSIGGVNALAVAWVPAVDTGGLTITSYDMRVSTDDGASWTVTADVTSPTTLTDLSATCPLARSSRWRCAR